MQFGVSNREGTYMIYGQKNECFNSKQHEGSKNIFITKYVS